jgi:hypothetical protein
VQKKVSRKEKGNFGREEFRAPMQDWPATSGRLPAIAPNFTDCELLPLPPPFFIFFIFFIKTFFWYYKEWAWGFGRMGIQHSHFLNLAPILGRVKSFILHGVWKFHFFLIVFAEIRVH